MTRSKPEQSVSVRAIHAIEISVATHGCAGISIPSRKFVVYVLSVCLVVLVPINWLVFRLMGRVEWAWVAAPIIAIVGAVADASADGGALIAFSSSLLF